ncbi:MAG: aminomethyl-transferring glycine dehydrogenase subunit GcvPA [Lachnospiraceae bacterium]|nr:aminomethyl-transferring glycine dehydrogenase subunit GcvPA [Lachnospiraceae bacterium]
MGEYIPMSQKERLEMLDFLGISSEEELFKDIPQSIILNKPLNLPKGISELELLNKMTEMSEKNHVFKTILRGAGAYDHYIPAVVDAIANKEEFVTAYTPYQAEISQGVLQSIYEFQSMICSLTGLDSSNASVYDGATAAAEAVNMCVDKKRTKALVSAAIKPDILEVIKTYCFGSGTEVVVVPEKDGETDVSVLKKLSGEAASFYYEQPNLFGIIEDSEAIKASLDEKTHLIMGVNPISLGVLKTPAEIDADIAVGEGQPLGMHLGFGGPYLGFMTCKASLLRKLPGRIVGETTDKNGNRGFVLTLQAREQHIRREKASSNICSNQANCALRATIYMSAMGKKGIREAAIQSMSKAHYMADAFAAAGLTLKYNKPFFNEFVTKANGKTDIILKKLEENDILGGLPLQNGDILWCATEKVSREKIDMTAKLIKEVL